MRLRVLGCHGGESPTHRSSSFLIDDHLLLDAGATTRGLSVPEQLQIDHVLISHSHLDHVRDLAMLGDNMIGVRKKPLEIHCTPKTAEAIEKHIFNNVIWPDFTKIPNPADPQERPTLTIERTKANKPFELKTSKGKYTVKLVPVAHPVECHAMFISTETGTLVYSADTGPTEQLWTEINKLDDLKALIIEVSFPNALRGLANVSGHLTPELLAHELKKLDAKQKPSIHLFHLKPSAFDKLKAEVADLGDSRLSILRPLEELQI